MHNVLRTIGVFAFSVLIAVIIALFGIQTFSKNQETTNLQNAFQTSLMTNRDDNARARRGVFAVNRDGFEKDFLETTGTYGIQNQMARIAGGRVFGLKVNMTTEDYTGRNGQQLARVYQTKTLKVAFRYFSDSTNADMGLTSGAVPVKAVRVIVYQRKKETDRWNMANVVTYVVSTDTTVSSSDISKE